nr:UTP--glucose-1-phosphate uridylyltransferase GalU [Planobispora longispora]
MADFDPVTKAVVPAAGLGTRFLPATKATPKEMLPIVDKPAIQYVVEEAVSAGLLDVLMVTGKNKRSIEDHFDRAIELEDVLEAKGDDERLSQVREPADLATLHYVRQGEPRGLGHAVLCAKQHVGDNPFACLLGDDLIDPRDELLKRMIEVRATHGGSVIALMEVPRSRPPVRLRRHRAHRRGRRGPGDRPGGEAPADEAPSNWAIIGRYVIDPAVFGVLENTPPGRGGEIQLTDALRTLAARDVSGGGPVHGVLFRGRRYDTGNKLDYLRTVVQFAAERPDLAPEFLPWLKEFLASR